MVGEELALEIRVLAKHGMGVREIAREVANARVHATTGAVRAERLADERAALQPIPLPYPGRALPALAAPVLPVPRQPIVGLQHLLSVYDLLAPPPVPAAPVPPAVLGWAEVVA